MNNRVRQWQNWLWFKKKKLSWTLSISSVSSELKVKRLLIRIQVIMDQILLGSSIPWWLSFYTLVFPPCAMVGRGLGATRFLTSLPFPRQSGSQSGGSTTLRGRFKVSLLSQGQEGFPHWGWTGGVPGECKSTSNKGQPPRTPAVSPLKKANLQELWLLFFFLTFFYVSVAREQTDISWTENLHGKNRLLYITGSGPSDEKMILMWHLSPQITLH